MVAAIPIASRVGQLAEFVEVAHRSQGVEAARAVAERRSGTQFDPAIVDALCADADKLLDGLDEVGSWKAVIDAEPALTVVLSADEFDAALLAIATFVDLKSPYTLGHSQAVAELVAAAGVQLGLEAGEVRTLHRAGLVHDFGRLGVSNSIWDKRGPLSAGEWERVRMHPYFAERMLQQSETLAPLARIAVQHWPSCAPRSGPAGSIPMPSKPSWSPPAIASGGDGKGRRG
jgi:HD-GYP domain-containing protein (c-di-GMP phosphodiesterase class II)